MTVTVNSMTIKQNSFFHWETKRADYPTLAYILGSIFFFSTEPIFFTIHAYIHTYIHTYMYYFFYEDIILRRRNELSLKMHMMKAKWQNFVRR